MIIRKKEKELEYFKTAKNYFNSNPQEYAKSLEELNKISLLIKNITIIHLKTLCLLMLTKYEDIIEFYYIYRKYFDSIFNQANNNDEYETNETKKIISIAFYNLGMRQKAKILCPDIKDDYQIIKTEHQIIQNKIVNKIKANKNKKKKIQTNRLSKVNESIFLENIEEYLEENKKNKTIEEEKMHLSSENIFENSEKSKNLHIITSDFVDSLFKEAMKNAQPGLELKKEENGLIEEDSANKKEDVNNTNEIEGPNGAFIEENETIVSNESNNSKLFEKLKNELNSNNINIMKKEDGDFMTLEEKIKYNEKEENNINDNKIEEDRNKGENNNGANNNNEKENKNNEKENNNNEKNKENNTILKSNRSDKYQEQNDLKDALNKQFSKKLTNEKVSVKIKFDKTNSKENIKNKKEGKKDDKDKNQDKNDIIPEGKKEENIDNKNETKEENKVNHNISNSNIIKKSFTHDKKINFLNKEIKRINPKPNTNDKNAKNEDSSDDRNKRISDGLIKNCKTYGFKNPFEFTLNPEDGGSFKPISSKSSQNENKTNSNDNININDKKDEDVKNENNELIVNINHNRALLRVEVDGEQIDLVQNENPSRKDSKYDNYINIDYNEYSSKKRKKMIEKFRESAVKNFDIKSRTILAKGTKVNFFNQRGNKILNQLNINEDALSFTSNEKTQTNLKNSCFYKTSYFLDKFDSKIK